MSTANYVCARNDNFHTCTSLYEPGNQRGINDHIIHDKLCEIQIVKTDLQKHKPKTVRRTAVPVELPPVLKRQYEMYLRNIQIY